MCDCIKEIEQRTKDEQGAECAFVLHKGYSKIRYTRLTKKGMLARHSRYIHENWKYCPFCGKAPEEEK